METANPDITHDVQDPETPTILGFLNSIPEFQSDTWSKWREILSDITPEVEEFYAICGRGSGKSRITAALACYFATQRDYPTVTGERIYVGVIAPDRAQARVTFRYIAGLLIAGGLVSAEQVLASSGESLDLDNGISIEVITASVAASRGRSYALVILEEAAFLPSDTSANPDVELLRAVRPALARVKGSLLCVISSPYARRGILWTAARRSGVTVGSRAKHGNTLVVQMPTRDLNPAFNAAAIDRAYEEDPIAAAAEYGAEFRSDVETFVSRESVEACVEPGVFERGRLGNLRYTAFVDPSGGSSDSFTLAIGHTEQDGSITVDAIRERTAPFSPEDVVDEFSKLLKTYGISSVTGDRYAGEWPREQFRKRQIEYEPSPKSKGECYKDFLPRLNSGRVTLLDHPKLVNQLVSLERRTARGGKDSIDHPPGGHDDVANAVAGLCEATPGAGQSDWVVW